MVAIHCNRYCSCTSCSNQDPQYLGYAWSNDPNAIKYLAIARLLCGLGVTAFAIWSWVDLSHSEDFENGTENDFGLTAIQITNWGVTLVFSYFLAASLGVWPALKSSPGTIRDISIYSSIALFVTSLCFEMVITILSWTAFNVSSLIGPSLGSFITKHAVLLLLLLIDLSVSRLPTPLHTLAWPVGLYLIYVFAAGMYAIGEGKGPYEMLNGKAGETVGAVFIAFAIILITFVALFYITKVKTRSMKILPSQGIVSTSSLPTQGIMSSS
jgi:hypothetical protein